MAIVWFMRNRFVRNELLILRDLFVFLSSREFRRSDANVRQDDYIGWLCQNIGGWLTPDDGNLRAFDHAIRNMPDQGAIVEIGSYFGLSTNMISYLAYKYKR